MVHFLVFVLPLLDVHNISNYLYEIMSKTIISFTIILILLVNRTSKILSIHCMHSYPTDLSYGQTKVLLSYNPVKRQIYRSVKIKICILWSHDPDE